MNENVERPRNYLVASILATIFCCLPFGIVGIIYAAQVDGRYSEGNIQEAQRMSSEAKKWSLISLGCGLLGVFVYVILFFAGLLGSWAITDFIN